MGVNDEDRVGFEQKKKKIRIEVEKDGKLMGGEVGKRESERVKRK